MQCWQLCVLTASLAAVVPEGCAIHCYSCLSRGAADDVACVRGSADGMELKKCDLRELQTAKRHANKIDDSISRLFDLDIDAQDPQLPMNCLKQVTRVGGQEIVLRGCQLAATEPFDICVKMKKHDQDNIRTTYCSLCNSDGCNPASLGHPVPLLVTVSTAFLFLRF